MNALKNNLLSNNQMLQPFLNCNDGNRATMVSSHLSQAIPLNHSEIPYVISDKATFVGKQSTDRLIKVAKNDGKTLAIFHDIFGSNYMVIEDGDVIDIVDISIRDNEGFASKPLVISKEKFKSGETLRTYNEISEDFIPKLGVNAYVGYMVYGDNFEDAFVISESFAKRTSHTEIGTVSFIVNANEYLIGGNKPFPEVGEFVEPNSRILAVKKRINKRFLGSLITTDDQIHFENDSVYYGEGEIVSINVLSNIDSPLEIHKPLVEYANQTLLRMRGFLDYVKSLIKKGYKFTSNFNDVYSRVLTYCNNDKKYIIKDTIFNGFYVEIKIKREVKTTRGSKLTTYHASKGLVGKIIPDKDMPVDENGKILDVIFNPNSVIGRQNLGQINEIVVNNLRDKMIQLIRDEESDKRREIIFKDFIGSLVKNEIIVKTLYENIDDVITHDILSSDNFVIPITPLDNPTKEDFKYLMNKYEISNKKEFSVNGEKIMNKITCGNLYMIKLKHEPGKKASYTSAFKLSEKTNQPVKEGKNKSSKLPFNAVPSACGEMELMSLLIEPDLFILRELVFAKSSNKIGSERFMAAQLLSDDGKIYQKDLFKNLKLEHSGVKNLREYLKVLGLTI